MTTTTKISKSKHDQVDAAVENYMKDINALDLIPSSPQIMTYDEFDSRFYDFEEASKSFKKRECRLEVFWERYGFLNLRKRKMVRIAVLREHDYLILDNTT